MMIGSIQRSNGDSRDRRAAGDEIFNIAQQIALQYKVIVQATNRSTPQWVVFAVAVCAGLSMFAIGFRLTDEVIIVAIPLLAIAFFGGAVVSARGWLWGVGMGMGILVSKLYPPPPYVPDARHLALYGPPHPLPLPFGLVASPVAQQVAGALIFMDAGLYFARAQAIAAAAGERMSWRWFSLATSRA